MIFSGRGCLHFRRWSGLSRIFGSRCCRFGGRRCDRAVRWGGRHLVLTIRQDEEHQPQTQNGERSGYEKDSNSRPGA